MSRGYLIVPESGEILYWAMGKVLICSDIFSKQCQGRSKGTTFSQTILLLQQDLSDWNEKENGEIGTWYKAAIEERDWATKLNHIHSKSTKICGFFFSASKNLRKKCVNRDNKILWQKCVSWKLNVKTNQEVCLLQLEQWLGVGSGYI